MFCILCFLIFLLFLERTSGLNAYVRCGARSYRLSMIYPCSIRSRVVGKVLVAHFGWGRYYRLRVYVFLNAFAFGISVVVLIPLGQL